MPDSKSKNEVDVFELLIKIFISVRSNFWTFVLLLLVGIGLGVSHFFTSIKTYEAKMIVSSGILTDDYAKILFENATSYLIEGSYASFAKAFNITAEEATAVSDVKIQSLNKVDDLKEHDRFQITLEITDKSIIPKMQEGIVSYLENNAYVKVRVEQTRTYLRQMLASTEGEIKALEALKTSIANGVFFQSAKGNVMFDPTVVNSKILELTDKKISYQNSLKLSNSVHVIEPFTNFEKQKRPKLGLSLISGAVLGLVLIGAVVAYKFFRKLLIKADEVNSRTV